MLIAKVVGLEEIERSWTRRDILDANDVLDALAESREDEAPKS